MKPTQSHYNIAQRIEDRRTGDRVADIDAIADALAKAERGGVRRALESINAHWKAWASRASEAES